MDASGGSPEPVTKPADNQAHLWIIAPRIVLSMRGFGGWQALPDQFSSFHSEPRPLPAGELNIARKRMRAPGMNDDPNAPPNLFTAIQEERGLRLEATKAPVDVMIIDHAEEPFAN